MVWLLEIYRFGLVSKIYIFGLVSKIYIFGLVSWNIDIWFVLLKFFCLFASIKYEYLFCCLEILIFGLVSRKRWRTQTDSVCRRLSSLSRFKIIYNTKKTSQYNINMNIFSMSFVHKVRSQWLHFKLIKSTEMPTCYLLTKNCSLQVLT